LESRLSGVRAVLFDLGDTVFGLEAMDFVMAHRRFATFLAGSTGLEPGAALQVAEAAGRGVRDALAARYAAGAIEEPSVTELARPHLDRFGPAAGDLAAALDRLYGEADIARWVLPPGRDAALQRFVDAGFRVAFVSNTQTPPDLMSRRLAEFGLLGVTETAVFSVEVGYRKPGEPIYRAALDSLGIRPSEALFVGDRLREDVLGPRALGMRAVLTHEFRREDPGTTGPVSVIASLDQLWELL
jgi:putative hydrolase of the HAD superfamily